jgi:hypothetical protein
VRDLVFILMSRAERKPSTQKKDVLQHLHHSTEWRHHPRAIIGLVALLCVCVLVQMLGAPVTLLSLLKTSDMLTESSCEDPSVLPAVPELRPTNALHLCVDGPPSPHLPVLATSVFHPPLT